MGDPVTNFEINSADPAKARRFYTTVFGWKMNEVPNNYTFVDTDAGGKGIGGGIGPLRGPKPFVTFYVVVRDLAATLKKATDGGGKVVFPVTKVGPTTTIAIFSDPDGNIIGLTDGK
ncbi:MAG: VOC family protein [Chloroflexi bacterium]|jgi:predicted enzyme related to lactoylglutathione lyase|nr:MAG: VOC family protein [Chloroflexota bacterium]